MAFLEINNVRLRGIAMAVPKEKESILDLDCFAPGEGEKVSIVTGIKEHRVTNKVKVASDYALAAAIELINSLNWDINDIDLLVYIPLARDYNEPNTSNLLQAKLGIATSCIAIDMPMACSGYIYGLSIAGKLLQDGQLKKALVVAGDTQSIMISPLDKTLWPINGDAVTVTALEYDKKNKPMFFNLYSDGKGYEALIAPASGVREYPSEESFKMEKISEGIIRNRNQISMDGMAVFQFAISKPYKAILDLCAQFNLDLNSCDFLLLHQANKMIDEKIRKKLNFPEEKVPYSLDEYGNSSSGTIPVTMVTRIADKLRNGKEKLLMCGFGAGLSWGAGYIETENLVIPGIIEL